MKKGKNKKSKKFVIPVAGLSFCLLIVSVVLNEFGILDDAMQHAVTADAPSSAITDAELTAHFIDVGQGDCSLFISGSDTMLIDSGEATYSSTVIEELRSYGVTQLDYVVATHAHSDHMGGMADIIETLPVDNIIISEPSQNSSETATYERFLDAVENSGAQVILAEPGYTFSLGSAECEILAPFEVSQTEENNNSVVLYITAGTTSFLMTGDAEKAIEKDIAAAYPNLKATVLKVGHHGSKTSSGNQFLSLLQSETAVISVGAGNSYRHPSEDTVSNLENNNIKYYRTDICGTVTVTCGGDSYAVTTEK